MAPSAGVDAHVGFELVTYELGAGVGVAAHEVGDDALEAVAAVADAAVSSDVAVLEAAAPRAVQKLVLKLGREVLVGGIHALLVVSDKGLDELLVKAGVLHAGEGLGKSAVVQRKVRIVYDKVRIHALYKAQAVAFRAGAEGRVEGKAPGFELSYAYAVLRTGEAGRKQKLFALLPALDYGADEAAFTVF